MQLLRVSVEPKLIRWARTRANYSIDDLTKTFKKLPEWESGDIKPTVTQVEAFARKVHVPVGYMYCDTPPEEDIPISDFRTFSGKPATQPSPNLLTTLYDCELRQDWYRGFATKEGLSKSEFVGSASIKDPPINIAKEIVGRINFDRVARASCTTWHDALRYFIRQVDEAGILVMISGIVRGNTHRKLNPEEFTGFALADPIAPLIFVNGADIKAIQSFTLANELAHLWLGESALSDSGIRMNLNSMNSSVPREEVWCNAVAAEMLVPIEHLKKQLHTNESLEDLLFRLVKLYKVSSLVVLRRMLDASYFNETEFEKYWLVELSKFNKTRNQASGGNFYCSTISRVGRRFAYALVSSANVGNTLSRDAFRLLGIKRADTYDQLARELKLER